MKKILLPLLLLVVGIARAQNIPNGVTGPAAAVAKPLPYYIEPSKNYLRVLSPVMPLQYPRLISISSPVDSVLAVTQYFDELHRPIQKIIKQASPLKKDNVILNWYDEFGRPGDPYLPYTAQTANTDDGKFKVNPFLADSAFNKSMYPSEQIYYAEQKYDGSPLNRLTKTTAVGNSFTGSGIGISQGWRANTAADSVVLWTVAITSEDDVPVKWGLYAAGSLMLQETTDERGIKIITYVDENGKTILTKKQLATSPSSGHYGWLCTYYVYDEMNHLRLVIPPKATEALNTTAVNWNLAANATINTNLCYAYYYDTRGRVTMKRIPGKGKYYIAYDLLDRVVMTQDPKLRTTNQWAFVLFDGQSRPVKSGIITSSLTKDVIIAQAAASSNYPALSGTYTVTTEAYYDDYTWIAATGAPVSSSLNQSNINSTNFNTNYNTAPDYPQPITQCNRIRGAATGVKKLVLNSSTYLYSVSFFDDFGRTIQTAATNYTGGTDVATVQYGFTSRVLRSHSLHQKSGTNAQTHTLLTKYQYDHVGRLQNMVKNFDGLGDKTLAAYTYNELGQVQTKTIAPNGGANAGPLETQTFAYNIQGAMLSMNGAYVTNGTGNNYFGEILSYQYGFTATQVNGNMAGVQWRAAGDQVARAYGYSYDNANRLTIADFSQQNNGSTNWTKDKADYTVSNLNYDANGNILAMKQRGLQINSSTTIDSLSYQYFTNSNQLQKVSDGIADPSPMGDFKDTTLTGDDYTYDANGNINKDYNRHLHTTANGPGAVFNVLDKAESITIAGKSTTLYYYDAAGALLRKQVTSIATNTVSNYVYAGAYVYKNDTLQTVFTEEGQIRKMISRPGDWAYDYFIKDHQGNIRTVLAEATESYGYGASMEPGVQAREDALFSNIYTPTNTVFAKPSGFDNRSGNTKVCRLNANTTINKKTGPGIVLKVMAGDKVQLNTYAFYNTPTQAPLSGVNLLADILAAFTGGVINNSGGKYGTGNSSTVSSTLSPNVTNFLNNDRPYDNTRPKAFLNWILVDNQFNKVTSSCGAMQVVAGSSKQALVAPLLTLQKSGYLYVYVSNESPQNVYFDDITIAHIAGPLVQEQSFYPYGLQMSAISDKAALKPNTPYKYNGGVELEEDGIDYYNTFYRKYDAQIGRFTGVDIFAAQTRGINPYQFGFDNPGMFNDPSGALTTQEFSDLIGTLWNTEYGGTWSSQGGGGGGFGGGGNVWAFTSNASAVFFGGLAAGGNSYGFGTDGNLRINGLFVTSISRTTFKGNAGISVGGYYENGGTNVQVTTKFFKNSAFGFSNLGFNNFGLGLMQTGGDRSTTSAPTEGFGPWYDVELTARFTVGSAGAKFWNTGIRGGYREVTVFGWKDNNFELGSNIIKNGKFNDKVKRSGYEIGVGIVATQYEKEEFTHLDGTKETVENAGWSIGLIKFESSKNLNTGKSFEQFSIDINATIGIGLSVDAGIKIPLWRDFH